MIGKIISSDQNIGIIKYVGPIYEINDSDIWYGIEWKDPQRGKHDGSYKGRRYFETKHPTSGSFVRENKIDFGVDIWKAAQEKYLDTETPNDKENGAENNGDKDEIIFNNLANNSITCCNLSNYKISSVENVAQFREVFQNIKELELESNLLDDWTQIFKVINELPKLKLINVSNNILKMPSSASHELFADKKIEYLIMNRMDYNWNDVLKILPFFPRLKQLKVCFNQISRIDELTANLVENLTVLDLESNPIENWKAIKKLGELNELEVLYLNHIGLSEIEFEECTLDSKTCYFPRLKSLSLNGNNISQWSSINELNKLKSLEELCFKSNPLNATDREQNIRQIFLAKLESLNLLNRTKLLRKEKMHAEIDYLKTFGKEWFELNKVTDNEEKNNEILAKKAAFLRDHPRYTHFIKSIKTFIFKFHAHPLYKYLKYEIQEYGALEESEIDKQPENLKSSLIALTINDETSGKIIKKSLPGTLDIQRFKNLLIKLFKSSDLDFDTIQLFYKSQKNERDEYELDNDLRTLSYYALENNDTILIRKKQL